MDDIKDRVKEKKYRNWVKSTLGLDQTKKAIQEYVEQKFTVYTAGTATLHHNQQHLTRHEISHIQGTEYIRHSLDKAAYYTGSRWIWKATTYNCPECESSFDKILSLHRKGRGYKNIFWENSGNTLQISLEWAIAKIFMPQGNKSNNKPADTDPYALFHLMLMCDLFFNNVRSQTLTELKEVRNTLFHSEDNLVTDADEADYFKLMIQLLSDALNDMEVSQTTRDRISEDIEKMEHLRDSDLTMTIIDDLDKALQVKRTAIYYDFEESLCEGDPEKLRELLKISEQLGGDMQLLKKHLHDLKNIDTYKTEIAYLRKQRDDMRDIIKTAVNDLKFKNSSMKNEVEAMNEDFIQHLQTSHNLIDEKLKCVPRTQQKMQLKEDLESLKVDFETLKQTAQHLPNSLDEMDKIHFAFGQWKRLLRAEISKLESEGVIVIVIAAIIISLLLRLLM